MAIVVVVVVQTKDKTLSFETVRQGGHVLFARTDIPISLKENYFTTTK